MSKKLLARTSDNVNLGKPCGRRIKSVCDDGWLPMEGGEFTHHAKSGHRSPADPRLDALDHRPAHYVPRLRGDPADAARRLRPARWQCACGMESGVGRPVAYVRGLRAGALPE